MISALAISESGPSSISMHSLAAITVLFVAYGSDALRLKPQAQSTAASKKVHHQRVVRSRCRLEEAIHPVGIGH